MEIVITWKEGKACAEIPELPGVLETGRSAPEALGNLVISQSEKLNLPLKISVAN